MSHSAEDMAKEYIAGMVTTTQGFEFLEKCIQDALSRSAPPATRGHSVHTTISTRQENAANALLLAAQAEKNATRPRHGGSYAPIDYSAAPGPAFSPPQATAGYDNYWNLATTASGIYDPQFQNTSAFSAPSATAGTAFSPLPATAGTAFSPLPATAGTAFSPLPATAGTAFSSHPATAAGTAFSTHPATAGPEVPGNLTPTSSTPSRRLNTRPP
ncbi:MAG: hypothetical protein M1833_003978 [Piccolia ochrophora]|nr:MAG: hypothetical protein M1833_003978 [Piccolia ochrophora]